MAKRTWKRRNYFIKKELQGRYIFSFFVAVVLGSILFTVIFSYLSADTFTVVYRDADLKIGKTPAILLFEMLRAYWLFIIIGGVLVVIIAMFLTHRFAGPLYRFERSLDEMIRGNLGFEIRLRQRDEGKEVAGMINRFNSMLSAQVKEMRDISEGIGRDLSEISRALPPGDAGARESLGRAEELNRRLQEILRGYTVKNE